MIIGNGILANALKFYDKDDVIFFASGVSNSLEKEASEFEREISLLKSVVSQNPDKKFFYFSTCSIYDPTKTGSPYVIHKLTIEKLIAELCQHFVIFRVGNAVGHGGNPNTLINFLKNSILSENKLMLHNNARRILIGTDDIASFICRYSEDFNNEIINLAYPYQYSLPEILSQLETHLDKKADYEVIEEGSFYKIEFNSFTEEFFSGISPDEYLKKLYSYYL
ncbi:MULTISPECIES: NAD-dependent epimerase/dehydratase family protein [unclassified Chryseobacterium]|uniref:NAD-dependent epimerase/dehydratase family protein n=1 Tax=unclassified Chryseobacterium TaxID=2593645 RepID=UPI000953B9A2|nr:MULTISPECIES: NAD-dependent epimerase/dehydratase family protein [unclassified Chryseobacterium]PXW17137.1 nucleoside-diphosphate-sugar epimerase [Chryseobacterium sp. CBTAP 102]SIQ71449.1 Nucleoside-diphosphate-sugar epimerase [Chryseobacterium sp. RU33C]